MRLPLRVTGWQSVVALGPDQILPIQDSRDLVTWIGPTVTGHYTLVCFGDFQSLDTCEDKFEEIIRKVKGPHCHRSRYATHVLIKAGNWLSLPKWICSVEMEIRQAPRVRLRSKIQEPSC